MTHAWSGLPLQRGAMSKQFSDRVVVITGASSGFGKGVAYQLARAGASLMLAARRKELLDELARECIEAGADAEVFQTDVSKADDVQQLAIATVESFGRIDVWINDAGVGALGSLNQIPLEDQRKVIETDLLGTLYGSYYAMEQFRKQGSGTLINIASVLGKVPAPYYAAYTAAKHGVVGLTGSIRQEVRAARLEDIHVCTVLPTATDTPFFEHAANYSGHESVPIPPVDPPEKVIEVIVGLLTKPEDEVAVGMSGKLTVALERLVPEMLEKQMTKNTRKAQLEDAPEAPPTTGAVHRPSEGGASVRGRHLKH